VVETAIARNYRSASMLRFPLWIAYGMIPLGGTLLGLATLRQLFIPNSVESNDSIKEF
jgi:TRAP-type C4-dicarboxylate transport system permease small subunit